MPTREDILLEGARRDLQSLRDRRDRLLKRKAQLMDQISQINSSLSDLKDKYTRLRAEVEK